MSYCKITSTASKSIINSQSKAESMLSAISMFWTGMASRISRVSGIVVVLGSVSNGFENKLVVLVIVEVGVCVLVSSKLDTVSPALFNVGAQKVPHKTASQAYWCTTRPSYNSFVSLSKNMVFKRYQMWQNIYIRLLFK
jgi:hypothetical protein